MISKFFFQNGKVVLKNENLHARLADQVSDFRKIIPQKAIDIRRQQGASGGNIACAAVQFVFEDGVIVQQDFLSKRALLPFFTTVHGVSENWESYDGNLIQNFWICFPSLGEVTVPEMAQKLSSIPRYIDTELQIAESFFLRRNIYVLFLLQHQSMTKR